MFIELIDLLRCTEPHEEVPLVGAFTVMSGRHVVEGSLGCHVCGARYQIRGGIADFGEPDSGPLTDREITAGDDDIVRLAAYLDLVERGRTVLLFGAWSAHGARLADLTGARVIVGNRRHSEKPQPFNQGVSDIRCRKALPLATGSLDGMALDAAACTMLPDAARVLRPKGRILMPAGVPILEEVSALAADEWWTIGAKTESGTVSRPIPLRSARSN
jgi:hypothetical protein